MRLCRSDLFQIIALFHISGITDGLWHLLLLRLFFQTILIDKIDIAATMQISNSILHHLESLGMIEAVHSFLE